MDDGLLSALGAGFQGMGAVASPAVAQRQEQERQNALPNMIRSIQAANAIRQQQADQAFHAAVQGKANSGMTSSALLDAVKDVDPYILATSPAAQGYLQYAAQRQAKEAAVEKERARLQAIQDRLNKPTEHVVNGKLVRSYMDGRVEVSDLPGVTGTGNVRYSISPKDYTPESLKKYAQSKNIGDLVPLNKSGGTNDPAKGWTFYKDKSGNLLRFNPNAGLVEKKNAAGAWEQTDELPEGLTKLGNLAGGGALNQRYSGRVIGAANEGFAAISSIAKLSDPSSGLFSAKAMGGAEGKNILAGYFTPEKIKRYNATIAGLANEIATAQNQGMVPNEEQIKAVREAISIGPTDDGVTARYRVALAARYLRKGLEVSMDLANPDQKKRAEGLLKQLEKIPDPDSIETDNKGPGMFPPSKSGSNGGLPPGFVEDK